MRKLKQAIKSPTLIVNLKTQVNVLNTHVHLLLKYLPAILT